MQVFVQFALLGLGLGALYALTSQGLLIVYRGSGILNFGHGAFGMAAAYIAWEFNVTHGLPFVASAFLGVAVAAALGALTHLVLMRNLRRASPLARTVATLGVLIVVQSVAVLRYGTNTTVVRSWLPTTSIHLGGSVTVSSDRLILLSFAVVCAGALWTLYRYSSFGMATTATAENRRAAATLGLSPDRIATVNWALGSALGGVAAILITPIIQLQVTSMTNLLLAALATALVADFVSFPIALLAGLGLGVLQSELTHYVSTTGVAQSAPFAVIVIVMVVRGRGLPLRDFFLQRLPAVGTGRIRWQLVLAGAAVGVALITLLSTQWQDAFATSLGVALVLLSIVVLTGYAGQISLGQFALAGTGAYIAGRLSATHGMPFVPALIIGILGAVPVGLLFALPAVRTRGINLAIVTLGLGTAIQLIVFASPSLTGGFLGTTTKVPELFGYSIDPTVHPDRYALFALGLFTVFGLIVANVRRGTSGRRMLAVRTNERAAAALGINVFVTKLYAFGLSSAIASAGGIVIAFHSPTITYSSFDSFTSINDLAWSVIGGVGFVFGAVQGSFFAPGAVGAQLSDQFLSELTRYIPLIGGITLLLVVLQNQDGVVKRTIDQAQAGFRRLRRSKSTPPRIDAVLPAELPRLTRVTPRALHVEGLTVSYGAVVAASEVSFTVRPGTVFGLIGPNGAGKTTVIDAVTGFTGLGAGRICLDDRDISQWSAARRARAGCTRSFQSLELFDDMTVLDNLRTAADTHATSPLFRDLIHPDNPPLPAAVIAAIREFGLSDHLSRTVEDLPYGQRRLLAIARAVATSPSVLLLDEPAAGLGDRESAELAHLVRRLADDWGIAVLLVEHDMNFVMSICDEIAVLDFGRVIAAGQPESVRADPIVIAAYLGEDDESAPATKASHAAEPTVMPTPAATVRPQV